MDRGLYKYVAAKFNGVAAKLGGWHSEDGTDLDDIVTDLAEEFEMALALACEAQHAVDKAYPRYASHDSIGEPV